MTDKTDKLELLIAAIVAILTGLFSLWKGLSGLLIVVACLFAVIVVLDMHIPAFYLGCFLVKHAFKKSN